MRWNVSMETQLGVNPVWTWRFDGIFQFQRQKFLPLVNPSPLSTSEPTQNKKSHPCTLDTCKASVGENSFRLLRIFTISPIVWKRFVTDWIVRPTKINVKAFRRDEGKYYSQVVVKLKLSIGSENLTYRLEIKMTVYLI